MIQPGLSFATDPRLAALSFQARDLLRSIAECFPVIFDENGRVPADCASLRRKCYAHRADVLDSHIGRWLRELELNSVVILWQTSDRSKWLALARQNCRQSPGRRQPAAAEDGGQRSEVGLAAQNATAQTRLPLANAGARDGVIHISAGLSPPSEQEIIAVAAAASSSSDLIERLAPHFPRHDVPTEFDRYFAYRKKQGRPAISSGFAKWMIRAEVPLGKVERKKTRSAECGSRSGGEEESPQLDLFEDVAHRRFVEQLEERKQRRSA